jgi:glutaredoxin
VILRNAMMERKPTYEKIFFGVSALGALFVLTEIIMQALGKSLCFTGGCKVAAQTARFGEISILIIGLLLFVSLALVTASNLSRMRPVFERIINIILIVALACEGFFMGYLAFRLQTVCLFCVIVFGLLVILGMLRLLSGHHEVVAGFAASAAIFSLLYLVLPVGVPINLPEHERIILFYSKDCKYCAEVVAELERNNISAKHVDVGAYSGLLKSIGIEGVPTLMVNDPNQKVFFTGQDAIRKYLAVCSATRSGGDKTSPAKARNSQLAPSPGHETELKFDIFTQQDLLSGAGGTASGSGLCKEDEICK